MEKPVVSLFEVHEFVRRVVALNFPSAIWIRAEIASSDCSKGHFFLDLIEKNPQSGDVTASAQAIIWASTARKIEHEIGYGNLETLIAAGREVKIRARPEFNERFGLRLLIDEIDADHGLGQLEIERRRTLDLLKKERLLFKNAEKKLPRVPQRIAVVSSSGAAGWADFQKHLTENGFGYGFRIELFESAVQGAAAEKALIDALEKVAARADDFDCAFVVRGGGSRLDLAVFDALDLCRKLAAMPLAVLTGIGHETDRSALDEVAFEAFKTPTAAADYLINRLAAFESELLNVGQTIRFSAANSLKMNELRLAAFENQFRSAARERLRDAAFFLIKTEKDLPVLVADFFRKRRAELEKIESLAAAFDPKKALRRGFTITRDENGKALRSARDLKKGARLTTEFFDGSVESVAD